MKLDYDKHRDVWGPLLALKMKLWSKQVFAPAAYLKTKGLLKLEEWGEKPLPFDFPIRGKKVSDGGIKLHLLEEEPSSYERVKYFDLAALEYEMATHDFKEEIVKESFKLLHPYVKKHTRILDCACGPGYESIGLSMLVPEGEVIALDLSIEMIKLAHRNAKNHQVHNMSFYQADASALPESFKGAFDLVYLQLSYSYFDKIIEVAKQLYEVLGDAGLVFLIEPVANEANMKSINATKAANPYFERLFTKEDFSELFAEVGFQRFYWKEILPGIGVSIITKNSNV